ncbi:hypothetical protein UFOVP28_21 [uncultured Caudovirales phage]|uniref:Terminase small subunit n=1 Tax=uncultured Caudovirales phage TaxID=2100421 RepID=A0A6J5KN15_9CAUD|nr:hypothetical protein UFOVP28_21 [uncultured Caudovirales phage]
MPTQYQKGQQDKIRGGLTSKQDQFAKRIAEGFTLAEAYNDAYPQEDSGRQRPRAQANAEGMRLKTNDKVIERINYYIDKKERMSFINPAKLRQVAIETIMGIALNDSSRDSDRLKAAELLGKIATVKLFETTVESNPSIRISDHADLERKLKALASLSVQSQPIDLIEHSIVDKEKDI